MSVTTDNEHMSAVVQIGTLAKATGLTVRTLRHYDAIGLMVPDERSYSGRRLYSEENVRRLYRIVTLRQLGLSLDEIAEVLDRSPDLSETIHLQLARVEQALALQRGLKRTLTRMLELLERDREPTLGQFIKAIEEITMIEKYYPPVQQKRLAQRRKELGAERIGRAEHEWAELIAAVEKELAAGTEATGPRMLELARRWQGLIEQFTGGDAGIRSSLETMYRDQGPQAASRGMVEPELMQYVSQALAALKTSS